MRYCTINDLEKAMSKRTLAELSHDPDATVRPSPVQSFPGQSTLGTPAFLTGAAPLEPDQAVLEESIRQAEELVDAHLIGRYQLPLSTVPTLIRDAVVNLARYWLYARRPERDLPDAVKEANKSTLKLLEGIRDAKLSLGIAETGKPVKEPGEFRARSREQTYTPALWSKY